MSCTKACVREQIDSIKQRGYTGRHVDVGHLDTGMDRSHPLLRHQPRAFRHFDRNGFSAESPEPFDSSEHGTGLASIISGADRDGEAVGVAPNCNLYHASVIEDGDIVSRILIGMDWLLNCHVRIACIPLGIPGHTPVFQNSVRALSRTGALVVAPIGNAGAGKYLSPGNYEEVLSVGAIDAEGNTAEFSGSYCSGQPPGYQKPDILAPGVGIRAAKPCGGYVTLSGTSVACAMVAGVAALLQEAVPTASASCIKKALVETSRLLPGEQRHRCRAGIVDPEAALNFLFEHAFRTVLLKESEFAESGTEEALPKYIDPRLKNRFGYSTPDAVFEAIFISSSRGKMELAPNARGAAGRVLDNLSCALNEEPRSVRYVASADAAIVLARASYLKKLSEHPGIVVASAVDVNPFAICGLNPV